MKLPGDEGKIRPTDINCPAPQGLVPSVYRLHLSNFGVQARPGVASSFRVLRLLRRNQSSKHDTSRKSIVQTYPEFCVGFQCSKPRIETNMFNQNTPERMGLMRLQCFESQHFQLSSVGRLKSELQSGTAAAKAHNHLPSPTIYKCKTGYHLTLHHPHRQKSLGKAAGSHHEVVHRYSYCRL